MENSPTQNPEERIRYIHARVAEVCADEPGLLARFNEGDIRAQSILYMIYWFSRLRNNSEEQARIRENLIKYIGTSATDPLTIVNAILSKEILTQLAKEYVESLLLPIKTVDLVVFRSGATEEKDGEILCIDRSYYPFGLALPGGIIKDEDEDNSLNLPVHVFSALRVVGEKVLGLAQQEVVYTSSNDENGKAYILVHGKTMQPAVRLYAEDEGGYVYRENTKSVLRPSDPRHIVDTIAFKCEIIGETTGNFIWRKKSEIMSEEELSGGFAFGHHREIVAHITAETSLEKERQMKEREFIRDIIREPLASYRQLQKRFLEAGNSSDVSFKELFPMVDRLLSGLFSEDINNLCVQVPLLAGVRDKAVVSLRQVCLKNRTFCPYLPTLHAIAGAIAFFDLAERQKMGFYDAMPKDRIVEHNPTLTPHASYHMYRYKYRLDQLLNMVPGEFIIPTHESLSATDLMRVRGVPIRFIGLSHEFLYVDEFEQSPEEFFMHDCNHSWRMVVEDRSTEKRLSLTKDELIEISNDFSHEYLDHIKIHATDTEVEREMKKLKKIILFEIVHEDARPFLKEVICKYIQVKEGGAVPFEVPRIDPKTHYMDVVDTLDTGISTLSYVRNKLQHGFYDHIDAQQTQIVGPKYRTAEWVSRAAFEMLTELEAKPSEQAELDSEGNIAYEWLLRRTCAVGPDNIHNPSHIDPNVEKYGDGAEKLNPKRYQTGK